MGDGEIIVGGMGSARRFKAIVDDASRIDCIDGFRSFCETAGALGLSASPRREQKWQGCHFCGSDSVAVINKTRETNQQFLSNVLASLVVLAITAVFVVALLRLQDYVSPGFLAFSLYAFPLPVACGVAVGFVSPRRAIVWAPLWASILAGIILAVIFGQVHATDVLLSPLRHVFTIAGMVIAALAGLGGEYARLRGRMWLVVAAVVLMSGLMSNEQNRYVGHNIKEFQDTQMPQILLELDRDYISIPHNLDWQCVRKPSIYGYEINTHLNGGRLRVLASAHAPKLLGVEYSYRGKEHPITNEDSAREYLESCGFRDKLLSSLSMQNGARGSWLASLEGTRLVLSNTGSIRVNAIHTQPDNPIRRTLPTRQ
ncbi:MAG: hypothetical protein ABFD54_02810 [Armatimonadota bacterium]